MCDIHRQFILCSCAISPEVAKDPDALTWTLSRHLGYNDFSMEGILAFPSIQIANGFKSEWVESQLNAGNCFDFDYKPGELDELRIHQGPDRSYEPRFLSFVYRDGQWRRDDRHGFETSKKKIHEGKLEFAEKTRRNTLRSLLIRELEQIQVPYSSEKSYLLLTLQAIEAYDPNELEAEPDIEFLVEMILQSVLERFGDHPRPDAKFLQRVDVQLMKAAQKPKTLPTVPARRPMSQSEWFLLWEKYQLKLARRSEQFIFDEEWPEWWAAQIATPETMVYQLHPFSYWGSHVLSSLWIPKSMGADNSYWTDLEFTWAVYKDEMGYWYRVGDF